MAYDRLAEALTNTLKRCLRRAGVAVLVATFVVAGACSESDSPTEPGPDPTPPATGWVDVSLGRAHTCALRHDGQVFCWGDNRNHQVGPGADTLFAEPQAVTLPFAAVDVEVGWNGSCARGSQNRYHCWGSNTAARLGVVGDTLLETPAPIGGPDLVSLSVGSIHSCGVTRAGEAYCWGGGGSTTGRDMATGSPLATDCAVPGSYLNQNCQPTPVLVSIPEGVRSVGTGVFFSCALGLSGVPYCWGYDVWGQLGSGGGPPQGAEPHGRFEAIAVSGGLRLTSMEVGNAWSCGIDSNDAAHCWGADFPGDAFGYGQTVNGGSWQDTGSRLPRPVAGGLAFAQIATTNENSIRGAHSCAITTTDALHCWGVNEYGQLGTGSGTAPCHNNLPCALEPVLVDNGPISAVELGMYHSCALRPDGGLSCWGRNELGQLGLGDTLNRPAPTEIPLPPL